MTPIDVLTDRYAAAGVRYAEVAAAVLACRGRQVLGRADFADLVGVPLDHLLTLESGRRPPEHVPRRLAAIDPGIDWGVAGVAEPGDPGDPAARHPSAGGRLAERTPRHEPTGRREHDP